MVRFESLLGLIHRHTVLIGFKVRHSWKDEENKELSMRVAVEANACCSKFGDFSAIFHVS